MIIEKKNVEPGGSRSLLWILEYFAAPFIMLLLPLRHISQGIDISDTGYNLACFRFFGELDGMWVYVSYLANAIGKFFTRLPFGDTMMGVNLYCSLVVSAAALTAYWFLRRVIPWGYVFAGEVLAILLCWCAHVILYNYLTYLALILGSILLYLGIFREKKLFFAAAGVILGIGVSARFSNLTHMALITALWYHGFLTKRSIKTVIQDTLVCVAGYIAGILSYLIAIQAQYGLDGYWSMLFGLKTMSSGAEGYSTLEMLTGAFVDYIGSMKWGILFVLYAAAGIAAFGIVKDKFVKMKKAAFLLGFLVLLRLVYGRGMFGFDYNTYFSIFWWVSLFNVAALFINLFVLFRKDPPSSEKVLSALVVITILILPLGSNNRSYPVINDLFLIAPVTLYQIAKRMPHHFPVKAVSYGCIAVLFIQSIGFGSVFIFRDGSIGEKRDTKVENNGILRGMYTTQNNAESIAQITEFCRKEALIGHPAILFGDVPGLSYLLDMPSAITSPWSNLDSYNMEFWNADFKVVEDKIDEIRPVVIWGKTYDKENEKTEYLRNFIAEFEYEPVFENDRIVLYR